MQWYGHADRIDLEFFIRALMISKRPDVSLLAGELLNSHLVLIDQDVILERLDGAVPLKLQATIINLGGWREHLANNNGIDDNIQVIVGGVPWSTDDGDIRVGVKNQTGNFQS